MSNPSDLTDYRKRYEFAQSIAVEAGDVTLNYFNRSNLDIEWKSDGSPLTQADRASETLLRERIQVHFPDDSIIGEEFGETSGSSEFRWILDPIDGTKSFVCGVPLYGTMVAVECAGEALIGSVYFPPLREGLYAMKDHGAWYFQGDRRPQRARVSHRKNPADSVLLTTSVEAFDQRDASEAYLKLARQFKWARTWGDVYGYLLVATGRAEVMIDPLMNVWDAAALLPIIDEAGGRFSDWQGQRRIDSGDAIGSNGQFHDWVIENLK